MTLEMLKEYGYDLSKNYVDCGDIIFDNETKYLLRWKWLWMFSCSNVWIFL